ncbi:MAG: hypothetical protein LBG76_02275 [Treponema sp.]|jgi:hypothetical protein|nr:hypothetical protein [Treponema sp.]
MNNRPFIVNIINFIRAVEPRLTMDLLEPVREQLALLKKHELQGTFLFQYDSLLDDRFVEMLRGTPHEKGVWLEIMEPLVKDAGLPWRGRFPWDWYSHVGFSVGYTPAEREKLIDVLMEKFRSVWGRYPASAGSWLIDAHSLAYMADKYHITASCNCKEQWGTDGYTLWGGYYNQAYYPSRTNVLAPGNREKTQIPVPVFRMLGSDPVYQYDYGGVITLEPVYTGPAGGGGIRPWVDWFLDEAMAGPCLSFNYAQAGQENSFGWPAMKDGLEYQVEKLSALARAGKVRVETLEASGEWFKKQYRETPNSAVTALSDWKKEGRRSVWFCSKRYRVNFYSEGEEFWFRDLMLFDDRYEERYLRDTCKIKDMTYDNLPVIDGCHWSGNGKRAGWYLRDAAGPLAVKSAAVSEEGENLRIALETSRGAVELICRTFSLEIISAIAELRLVMVWDASAEMDGAVISPREMRLCHEGFHYTLRLGAGNFQGRELLSEAGRITLDMKTT